MTQHQQCHDTPTHPLTLRSGLQLTEDLTETTLLDEEMWCQSVPNKDPSAVGRHFEMRGVCTHRIRVRVRTRVPSSSLAREE